MHGSSSKIPIKKNLVRKRCAEGFNSGVKRLIANSETPFLCLFLLQLIALYQRNWLYGKQQSSKILETCVTRFGRKQLQVMPIWYPCIRLKKLLEGNNCLRRDNCSQSETLRGSFRVQAQIIINTSIWYVYILARPRNIHPDCGLIVLSLHLHWQTTRATKTVHKLVDAIVQRRDRHFSGITRDTDFQYRG
jgi:hypothetical protein